jgi:very-short-patch-repair endonuclease
MPAGMYVRTEEWKKRNSEMLKGRKLTDETKRKISDSLKGRIVSEETRRKISERKKGVKFSEIHKEHLRGKTRTSEQRANISKGVKRAYDEGKLEGCYAAGWYKGKHLPEEHRRNIGLAHKGKPKLKLRGRKHTEKSKKLISEKWHDYHTADSIESTRQKLIGRVMPEDQKQKLKTIFNLPEVREKRVLARSKWKMPFKDTKIEVLVQNYLKYLGMVENVDFETHIPFRIGSSYHQVDIYLPKNDYVIECDGIYWHSLPGAKERDFLIDKELFSQGVNVIRLNENEINTSSFIKILNPILGVDS